MNSTENSKRTFRNQIMAYLVAITLACSPIASDSIWWEICRGRTVVSGDLNSTAKLIDREDEADSDSLTGIAPWLVFEYAGVDGLMTLKLAGAVVLTYLLSLSSIGAVDAAIVVAVLISCASTFDPDHKLIDILGIASIWQLAQQRRIKSLGVLTTLWCNCSIGAIWSVPAILLSSNRLHLKQRCVYLAVILIALSINLRGPAAIVEMVRCAIPFVFFDRGLLNLSGFGYLQFSIPALYSAGLCCLAFSQSSFTLASRSIILTCGLVGIFNAHAAPNVAMIAGLSVLTFRHLKKPTNDSGTPSKQKLFVAIVNSMAAVAVLILSAGGLSGKAERIGWGLSDTLDVRLVERDLHRHSASRLLVHSTSTNGAGLALITLPNSQAVDVAEIAIKRGRFHDYAMLNHDLRSGLRTAYIRGNGNTGGWWNSLVNGQVDLLMVAASHSRIIAALEPTLWKPLSLDSPIIPMGQAGSSMFTRQIIETRDQRDFVEFSAWQYQLNTSKNNSPHTDLYRKLTGIVNCRSDIRQAQVFRSMNMLNAASRTILVVARETPYADRLEFLRINRELAWQQMAQCGYVSQWRKTVLNHLGSRFPQDDFTSLSSDLVLADSTSVDFSNEAIRLYCEGLSEMAADRLTDEDPETLFAKHSLYWQAGNAPKADVILELLQQNHSDHLLTLAAEFERGFH